MTSKKGSYTQTKSQLTAGNDVNVTAEGDVSVVSGILDDAPGGLLINEAMRAGNDANITSKNGNYDQSVASIVAKKDVNINAKKDVNIEHSAIYADKNVNMDSSKNINISGKIDGSDLKITDITAGNDVNVKAAGKITVSDNSKINAKTGNASLSTTGSKDNGNITISDSKVEAANDVNVKSTKGNKITVKKSNIIAGSDSEGFDVVNDANDTIGDVNIEAKAGSVYISDSSKVLSQDKDVNIIAKNDINFNNIAGEPVNIDKSSQIKAENNVLINSTDGNIRGEKTEMTTIEYGNRLTFDAAKDNEFTSQDSLKSVNVDYVAGNANRFYTQEDIQFVNSSLKAKDNFVESGKDVILNNLEIKTPDGLKSEEVTTQIFANGNVTTDNVTKEDLNAKGPHTFPQSVSTERSGKDKTVLDVGKTKVKITAETVKDPKNPDNGSITLNVKNADNDKAGLELTAQNVDKLDKDPTDGYHKTGYYKSGTQKWDENIDPHEGPEVHLDADDDKVSITSIITDKLTLDDKDTFTAVPDGDNDTAYIEVRDEGGFNFDDHPEFDPDPQGFKYRTSDMDVDKKQQDNWTEWHEIDRKVEVEETDTKITTTTTVTEQRENNPKITEERRAKEHEIEFDSQGNQTKFTLIYDKHDVKTYDGEQQIETRTNVDVQVEEKCPDLPDVDPVIHTPDSLINIVKIPREQAEISKTSKVSDNTVDQTSNIMSAAAKVDLSDAEENENSESEDSSEE